MVETLIELRKVWKTYRMGEVDVHALRAIDLEIYSDDFLAIMGPSGSGKSTMMNIMGCLDIPSKGKIFLYGHDIAKLEESELASLRGKKIGFVFQSFNLLPHLTAMQNVALPMMFQGVAEKERNARARELLTKVGLSHRLGHLPSQLSGGEQQRVAIARALSNDPEIILADEPTGNLDSATGKQVMRMLTDLHEKEKKTVIVVTHDPYIAAYAHKGRAYFLKDGTITSDHLLSKLSVWAEDEK